MKILNIQINENILSITVDGKSLSTLSGKDYIIGGDQQFIIKEDTLSGVNIEKLPMDVNFLIIDHAVSADNFNCNYSLRRNKDDKVELNIRAMLTIDNLEFTTLYVTTLFGIILSMPESVFKASYEFDRSQVQIDLFSVIDAKTVNRAIDAAEKLIYVIGVKHREVLDNYIVAQPNEKINNSSKAKKNINHGK